MEIKEYDIRGIANILGVETGNIGEIDIMCDAGAVSEAFVISGDKEITIDSYVLDAGDGWIGDKLLAAFGLPLENAKSIYISIFDDGIPIIDVEYYADKEQNSKLLDVLRECEAHERESTNQEE